MFDNAPGSLPRLAKMSRRNQEAEAESLYETKFIPILKQGLGVFDPPEAVSYELSLKLCFMPLLIEAFDTRDTVLATDIASMAALYSPFRPDGDIPSYAHHESKFLVAMSRYQAHFVQRGKPDLRRAITFIASLQVSAVFRGPIGAQVISSLSPQAAALLPFQ